MMVPCRLPSCHVSYASRDTQLPVPSPLESPDNSSDGRCWESSELGWVLGQGKMVSKHTQVPLCNLKQGLPYV